LSSGHCSAPPEKLLEKVSGLVLGILSSEGFGINDGQGHMIVNKKTDSFKAFELNAKGYGLQQEIGLLLYEEEMWPPWLI
jgi:hypothetical protein